MASLWFGFDLTQPFLTHSQRGSARTEPAGEFLLARSVGPAANRSSFRTGFSARLTKLFGSRGTVRRFVFPSWLSCRDQEERLVGCSLLFGTDAIVPPAKVSSFKRPPEGGGDTTMDSTHPRDDKLSRCRFRSPTFRTLSLLFFVRDLCTTMTYRFTSVSPTFNPHISPRRRPGSATRRKPSCTAVATDR
jgi:hypothetical protein